MALKKKNIALFGRGGPPVGNLGAIPPHYGNPSSINESVSR